METLTAASRQWATRKDDERYETLEALHEAVSTRHGKSHERNNLRLSSLTVEAGSDDNLYLRGHNGSSVAFTHHAFGQFTKMVAGPRAGGYLRRLPADLARTNLAYHLESGDIFSDEVKLLYTYEGDERKGEARAFSSPTYGRIWDDQVTSALLEMNSDGRWHVPPPFNKMEGFVVDKRSTTMYASDHDMFAFLVDENRPIDVDGQRYFRGFYAWNSEAVDATFGLATFLYSYVCCNRIIWDAREVKELRIRHTLNAPERFFKLAQPALAALSESSPQRIIDTIQQAKATRIAKDGKSVEKWLASRGFTKYTAAKAVALAAQGGSTGSSGDPTSLWDVIQGGTALARNISHTDTRVAYERQWSSLLRYSGKSIKTDDLPEPVESEDEAELAYAF